MTEGAERSLDRKGIRAAMALLEEAGWTVRDGRLANAAGEPFRFEILLNQSGSAMRSGSEVQKIVDIYLEALKPLGITPRVTLLDSAQYVQRTNSFAFDMTWYERGLSLSPGNEQALYWGSASATEPGSKNWMGLQSPAVDAMIEAMVNATSAEDHAAAVQALDLDRDTRRARKLAAAVKALDRILTAGRHVIPVSFSPVSRIAHAANLHHPARLPAYGDWPGFMPETWWADPPR